MLASPSTLRIIGGIVLLVAGFVLFSAFLQLLFGALVFAVGAYLLLRRPAARSQR